MLSTNTGSRSVLKAFGVFFGSLVLAGFAWAHGGWFGIFSLLILIPGYFVAAVILCGTEQYMMRKHPAFVPADVIRKPFVVIVVTLASQTLLTPVLSDNAAKTGYWSLFTGFQHAAEQSTAYQLAGGFYFLSNLVIFVAFVFFLVFVIRDIARARHG